MHKKDELNLLRQAGNWPEVEAFARRELEADPCDAFFLRALEQSLREQGKDRQLPEIWKTLVDDLGEHHPYAQWLGDSLLGQGDSRRAAAYFRLGAEGAIQAKDFDAIEEIWLELADLVPEDLEYFLEIAAQLERKREKARAGELLQLLIPHYESGESESLLRLLRRIVDLIPRDEKIRVETQRIFRRLYGGRRDLSFLLQRSGVDGDAPLSEAVARLESYLPFGAGQKVFHQDWGTGVVSHLDPGAGRIAIDFPGKPSHQMGFDLAQKNLEPLAADDLRALSPEEIRRLKDTEPKALVHAALRSRGGKASGRELKGLLCGPAVPEGEWSAWWGAVNKQLKTDPRVRVAGGGSRVYQLRKEEVRFEDEVRDRFDQARKSSQKVDILLQYMTHCRSHTADGNLLQHMADRLVSLRGATRTPAAGVEIDYVLEQLEEIPAEVSIPQAPGFERLLGDLSQAARVMEGLRFPDHACRWAARIKQTHPEEWPSVFADLILSPTVSVRDFLADHVLGIPGGDGRLRAVFERASASPREYPGPFIWFCQRWILQPDEGERFGQSACNLLERLFRLLDHLAFAGRRARGEAGVPIREHAADIRAFVKKNGFQAVKSVLENAAPVVAGSLRNSVITNAGLDSAARAEILRIIRTRFPHLAEGEREPGIVPPSQAGKTILCTRRSLGKKRDELRRLTEVEIPANAQEIQEARAHGDLSENAEYKFAKERQAMLHDRARDLQEALLRARPMDLDGIRTDRAGFGTRVTLRSEAGQTLAYTILGPWELESSPGALSYLSEEAAPLMGLEAGARVELSIDDSRVEFEVVAVDKVAEAG